MRPRTSRAMHHTTGPTHGESGSLGLSAMCRLSVSAAKEARGFTILAPPAGADQVASRTWDVAHPRLVLGPTRPCHLGWRSPRHVRLLALAPIASPPGSRGGRRDVGDRGGLCVAAGGLGLGLPEGSGPRPFSLRRLRSPRGFLQRSRVPATSAASTSATSISASTGMGAAAAARRGYGLGLGGGAAVLGAR